MIGKVGAELGGYNLAQTTLLLKLLCPSIQHIENDIILKLNIAIWGNVFMEDFGKMLKIFFLF